MYFSPYKVSIDSTSHHEHSVRFLKLFYLGDFALQLLTIQVPSKNVNRRKVLLGGAVGGLFRNDIMIIASKKIWMLHLHVQ